MPGTPRACEWSPARRLQHAGRRRDGPACSPGTCRWRLGGTSCEQAGPPSCIFGTPALCEVCGWPETSSRPPALKMTLAEALPPSGPWNHDVIRAAAMRKCPPARRRIARWALHESPPARQLSVCMSSGLSPSNPCRLLQQVGSGPDRHMAYSEASKSFAGSRPCLCSKVLLRVGGRAAGRSFSGRGDAASMWGCGDHPLASVVAACFRMLLSETRAVARKRGRRGKL